MPPSFSYLSSRAAESAFGGAAHILVACAGMGIGTYPSLANTATADFDSVFAVNTRGAFLCLREAANRLRRGGGGRIVAVSSTLAATLLPGYAASKAAVEAVVRVAAKELGSARVTVNCVAPGPVATELFFEGKSDEAVERFRAGHPMGRLGEVGDIAPAVGFLCTDAAEWVNGQVIRINGFLCLQFLKVSAFYGVYLSMIVYLQDVLHEDSAFNVAAVSSWAGVSYLMPLLGATLGKIQDRFDRRLRFRHRK
ncbi:NADPH-dependent aldehyde reductase-like protein, chloroplastic [Hordeum vulgare subsp. vulgare]|uniref:NADPH-dependent aldehyde reductase-like protein, chloroplastic n=1 Tax=Hordeum vulgare subsp. vulgare TaxID=112509 RepID=UPI001D1A4FC7|nr:NADPH-dependent aldehyde reductase-like protein, chloroplastic [Hordeum vulgare subsp. vulgare]